MKPLLIIICLWSFAVSAATNTVLTTTTNRTLAISALGAQMVSSNSAAGVRTLLNVTNATGLEATAANLATVSNSVTTLQTQLPGYVTNLVGLATNLTATGLTINTGSTNNSLTASRAMVTDANKGVVSSSVTATELGYVSGVTSALQTQIDSKPTVALTSLYRANVLLITNGLFLSVLSPTNSSYNANCTATLTNVIVNTPFETNLFTVTLPALSATNSRVLFEYILYRTNAEPSGIPNCGLDFTLGTNFINITSVSLSSSPTFTYYKNFVSPSLGATTGEIFRNNGSFTSQQPLPNLPSSHFSTPTSSLSPAAHVDTSAAWSLGAKLGWASGGSASLTNIFFDIKIIEVIPIY